MKRAVIVCLLLSFGMPIGARMLDPPATSFSTTDGLLEDDGNSTGNATETPSAAPSLAPTSTEQPTVDNSTKSPTPTMIPSSAPSLSPITGTLAPTVTGSTAAPTQAKVATSAPTTAEAPAAPKRMSFFRFIEKTIALFILLVLSLLAFGAIMNNRYRIYFFLRGIWYTILGMQCTRWVLRKLRLGGDYQPVDQGLNTVIFENEMDQGLLMRQSD
mmetsp:Transcript_22984/g.50094  ORF Transcript_22984/g.50094 Transcript_22984/m.50094 type:complete len:215 (-) Transcript_22984:267-911(-)|eukprot:CAMPEP_0168739812 /NCGR_PEP_ID=MMETSP0724-20121128/11655_1 /TAXON_ID=265536 /ORGANISM="Amphiprora sp., Strain CCMP467" /LENGTH=214 /DNA_ID=CAMNT_0008787225 /DNA_START=124 /DNA_END=768 /DNA_ORIENTATION=-